MSLSTGEKKFAIITAIVAVLFVAIVGGTVAALTVDHESSDVPYLQVASGSELVRVEPLIYCDIDGTDCEGSLDDPPTRIPVAVGDTAMISLSDDLAIGPWTVVVQYLTADGFDTGTETFYGSDTRRVITLASTEDKILAAVEIRQPSQVEVEGQFVPRGVWGLDTLPDGVEVPAAA